MKINKTVLDYSGVTNASILSPFFPIVESRWNKTQSTYDVLLLNRDDIQDNFEQFIKYLHPDSKVLVSIIPESGCLNQFLDYFDKLTKIHSAISFYLLVDSEFEYSFSDNVKVCSSYGLSFLTFFENFSYTKMSQVYNIDRSAIYEKQNGFCCLNGRLRSSRIMLLLELIKRNILVPTKKDSNLISFLFYTNEDKIDYEQYDIMVETSALLSESDKHILYEVRKHLPIKLIEEGEMETVRPSLLLTGEYTSKVLNFITENVSGMDCSAGIVTFTEKAWIPFKLHQIPIYSSTPNYVSTIRNMGFDLFDDVVNHSYDAEPDHLKRLQMAVDELERVRSLDLVEFYKENYLRFIKNNLLVDTLKMDGYATLKTFITENKLI